MHTITVAVGPAELVSCAIKAKDERSPRSITVRHCYVQLQDQMILTICEYHDRLGGSLVKMSVGE